MLPQESPRPSAPIRAPVPRPRSRKPAPTSPGERALARIPPTWDALVLESKDTCRQVLRSLRGRGERLRGELLRQASCRAEQGRTFVQQALETARALRIR